MRTVPFYQQIADTLRTRICDGAYPVNTCLPTSVELEESFQVSNITIRKALNVLKIEGWVETKLGVGMVVVRSANEPVVDIHHSGHFDEWLDWASGESQNVKQVVLGIDSEPGPPKIRRLLDIADGDLVWRMRRLRSRSQEPISYHISYGRSEFVDLVSKKDFQGSGSFIEFLQNNYPRKIARIEQLVEANVANIDLAKLLEVEFGAPIFFMEHTYRDDKDAVVAVSHLFMRADRYRYTTSIEL